MPDIADAIRKIDTASFEKGIPDGIDELPSFLDYPSVSLDGTPWDCIDEELLKSLENANWIAVTAFTTTPSRYSAGHNFPLTNQAEGWHGNPRVRAIGLCWAENNEHRVAHVDLDAINVEDRAGLYRRVLANVIIGADIAATLNWLVSSYEKITGIDAPSPQRVIDVLLIARLLRPTVPIELQIKSKDDETAKAIVFKGGSGWSFDALAFVATGTVPTEKLDLTARDWCEPAPLSDRFHLVVEHGIEAMTKTLSGLCGRQEGVDLLDAWDDFVTGQPSERMEQLHAMQHYPIILHRMHKRGVPFSLEEKDSYLQDLKRAAQAVSETICKLAPELEKHKMDLADPTKGMSEVMRKAVGEAFEKRGLELQRSAGASGVPKVGEKELRGVGATQSEKTRPLFEAMVKRYQIQGRHEMSNSLADFALRSPTRRLHSLFLPTTGTMRLSSSEPSVHSMPKSNRFRQQLATDDGRKIVAIDLNAMDVRNGAALAIRAQRKWLDALSASNFDNITDKPDVIEAALRETDPSAERMAIDAHIDRVYENCKQTGQWEKFETLKRQRTALRLVELWKIIEPRAKETEDGCWSGLREAFELDADIHTYTSLEIAGDSCKEKIENDLGESPSQADLKDWWKGQKDLVGDNRLRGKVGNLSLMYGMTEDGFQTNAAKVFDQHWSKEETHQIFEGWHATFPEIEFMNCLTDLGSFKYDTKGKRIFGYPIRDAHKAKRRPLNLFKVATLTERTVYAEGFNAGINYGNQGSGADFLMNVMVALHFQYPEVASLMVNQVHDELVFDCPENQAEETCQIASRVMKEEAERWLLPYGIGMELSSTINEIWLKD
jgi:hypothetical protein